ncbi:MAG: hypothetical protein HKP58_19920 [Desulfatitalea sp.]|nr:hypothetical protein [Desulfatitalea sp.]NNK02686.1 hypothetical protein [Desulfatitalea sp.]
MVTTWELPADALQQWFAPVTAQRPGIFENRRHDVAVSQGAACSGLMKLGYRMRVGSRSPRSCHIGIGGDTPDSSSDPAICELGTLYSRHPENGGSSDAGWPAALDPAISVGSAGS